MFDLTEDEVKRYSRHILLPEVGGEGQKKINNASVLVVGAGGLGSPCALYLASAGVGRIGLADDDEVDLSNLQRQILHHTGDIDKKKTRSGRDTINKINPGVEVVEHSLRLNSQNIKEIIERYDFVVEGSDNFPTKFLVNDACIFEEKPFVMGGILRFTGQAMTVLPHKSTCYRCVFIKPPPAGQVPTCQEAGVLGAIAGFIGVIQATEIIKLILEKGTLLTDNILTFDALTMSARKISVARNNNCPICSDNPDIKELIDYEQVCQAQR